MKTVTTSTIIYNTKIAFIKNVINTNKKSYIVKNKDVNILGVWKANTNDIVTI